MVVTVSTISICGLVNLKYKAILLYHIKIFYFINVFMDILEYIIKRELRKEKINDFVEFWSDL